jgi:hypothetical protein
MAFKNADGKNISYECSELIEELKADIDTFGGDKIVNVWCKESNGVVLYTNYDFIDPTDPVTKSELNEDEFLRPMTMTALLILLEEQNKIL